MQIAGDFFHFLELLLKLRDSVSISLSDRLEFAHALRILRLIDRSSLMRPLSRRRCDVSVARVQLKSLLGNWSEILRG